MDVLLEKKARKSAPKRRSNDSNLNYVCGINSNSSERELRLWPIHLSLFGKNGIRSNFISSFPMPPLGVFAMSVLGLHGSDIKDLTWPAP